MENFILTFFRLLIPLSIFKWPFWGVLASMILDSSDWHFFSFHTSADYDFYQVWDKILDTYYMGIAAFTTLFWRDLKAKKIAVFSYIYRVLGVLLFVIFQNRIFLFFFPNVFENFFLFYLIHNKILKTDRLFLSGESGIVLTALIFLPKIIHEFFIHSLIVNPENLLNIKPIELGIFWINLSFWILVFVFLAVYGLILWGRPEARKKILH